MFKIRTLQMFLIFSNFFTNFSFLFLKVLAYKKVYNYLGSYSVGIAMPELIKPSRTSMEL